MSSLEAMLSDIEEVIKKYEPNPSARREQATVVLTGSNVSSEWIDRAQTTTQSDLFDDPLLQRAHFGLVNPTSETALYGKK